MIMPRFRHNAKAITPCICAIVFCVHAVADEATPQTETAPEQENTQGVTEQIGQQSLTNELDIVSMAIDGVHRDASNLLNGFASQLDNYFAEENSTDSINKTSATIRLDFADPGDEDFSLKAKLKLRLVLPRSEQRVRLLFDVDEDIDDDTRSSIQTLSESDDDRSLALALQFIRRAREQISFNADLGVRRYEKKFQGFARLRVVAEQDQPAGWSYKISNDLRQYFSSGYLNRISLDFWRSISDPTTTVFRTSTNFEWRKNTAGTEIDQSVGLYRKLNDNSLLALEALAGYNTAPDESNNYYEGHQLRVRYRRNAFRPWFHFEVWPSVSWLKENDNKPKIGGLIRMEVSFGQY